MQEKSLYKLNYKIKFILCYKILKLVLIAYMNVLVVYLFKTK